MRCILHIGAGKCGSSTLQAALSARPVLNSNDERHRYEYVAITEAGSLLRKDALTSAARRSPSGYCCSAVTQRWATREDLIERLRGQFQDMAEEGSVPILSWEAWIYEAPLFTELELLRRLGLTASVFMFVRPQLPWINSAWWQWGAWMDCGFDHWLETVAKGSVLWADFAERWQAVPSVDSVHLFSATKDVTATFYKSLKCSADEIPRINRGLDASIIRFLQRNREFRPHQHDPSTEFILQRHLGSEGSGPWVIPHDISKELVEYYRDNNLKLISMTSREERSEIENEKQWWDPSVFADRIVAPPEAPTPSLEEVEKIAVRAIRAIIRLDEELRGLR